MKALRRLIPLTILVIMAACTAGGDEPTPEATATENQPALREMSPETPTEVRMIPTEPPTNEPTAVPESSPTPDDEAPAAVAGESGSVGPAEVDVSQITSEPEADATPRIMPQPGVPDPKADMVQRISQDLAGRLGVDVGDVTAVSAEAVDWPDSSLGCPQQGMVYLSVITPGYLITVEVSGERYRYHTDLQEAHVLCGEDGEPVSS